MRPPFAFMLLYSSALAFTGPPNILLLMPVRAHALTALDINLHHERTNQPLSPSLTPPPPRTNGARTGRP